MKKAILFFTGTEALNMNNRRIILHNIEKDEAPNMTDSYDADPSKKGGQTYEKGNTIFTGTEALKKAHAILKCEASHLILSVSLDDKSRQIDIFELYAHYYKADFNVKTDDYTFQEISRSEAQDFLDRVNSVKEIQFGGF